MRILLTGIFLLACIATFGQVGLGVGNWESGVCSRESVIGNEYTLGKQSAALAKQTKEQINLIHEFPISENLSNSWLIYNVSFAQSRMPKTPYSRKSLITAPNFFPDKILPNHYGFFCKVESKIERKSKLAPRFRLGSADYVDALEGKYTSPIK